MASRFNEEQRKIILHGENPLMVLASAGGGKSTVLTARTIKKIQEGEKNICVITFTRNTANDLMNKFKQARVGNQVKVGTFHSICGDILRQEGYNISKRVKEYELENIFKKVIISSKKINVKDIMSFISYQKNNMIGVNDDFLDKDSDYTFNQLRECYKKYEEYKAKIEAYDFDDYLLLGHKVLSENQGKYSFNWVFVDETQDSNKLQMDIVDLLCPSNRITVVGDYRQCMYSFRGSKPELFMDFYKTHENTEIINMNVNYRSSKQIVDRSNYFIRQYYKDYSHHEDALSNSTDDGVVDLVMSYNKEDESYEVADKVQTMLGLGYKHSDIAILYRNNIQSQYIENEFKIRNIAYDIENNGSFFNRKEVDMVMCMLRLIDNKNDDSAFETLFRYRCEPFTFLSNSVLSDIMNLSNKKKISHITASSYVNVQAWQKQKLASFISLVDKLITQHNYGYNLLQLIENIIDGLDLVKYIKEHYTDEEEQNERLETLDNLKKFVRSNTLDSFLRFVYEKNNNNTKQKDGDKVQMMTIHKSKGLEFKVVILVGLEQGKFPSDKSSKIEEANVFYVGVTRAIERMFISQIGNYNEFARQYYGDKKYASISESYSVL